MKEKIDFIIARVDGWDKEWQKERNKYAWKDPEDLADYRFRDMETLKYLFRWIEKFAPRVNNVFFVTCWHYPEWLNLNCPKLRFIKHEDYIPKEYLPTFNSHTIELNFHRIKDLSEHFVYFNDDMFLTDYTKESDFFENWLPKQVAWLSALPTNDQVFAHIMLNNILLINKHFSYDEIMNKNKKKRYYPWYSIRVLAQTIFLKFYPCIVWFVNPHLPNSILKSTMDKLREKENYILDISSKSKFRSETNVNQYIFSRYDIAKWNFMPRKSKIWHCFNITKNNTVLTNSIAKKKYKLLCINDTSNDFDFEQAKSEIIKAFEKILPEKSIFEK